MADERGGETVLDNLILLCGRHHKPLHDRHIRISGTGKEPVFTDEGGRVIGAHPPHAPPGYSRPASTASYVPHTARSVPHVSPTVAPAASATRSGSQSRASSSDAAARSAASATSTASWSRPAAPGVQPVDLPLLRGRVDRLQLGLDLLALVDEAVDAHDLLLARLDALLRLERLLLDPVLHPARLDRGDRTPELVDLGDQPGGLGSRARPSAPRRSTSRRTGPARP